MKKIFLSILLLASTLGAVAQNSAALLAEGRKLEAILKEKEALEKYEAAISADANNAQAYAEASFMLSQTGNRTKDAATKKIAFDKAMTYAQKAIKLNDKLSEAHYAYAVAMGRVSLLASSEERLKYAKQIKTEAERSIALDAKQAGGYYILGKLNREISNMSSIKIIAAKALYGGVPEGCSFTKAEEYFNKAIELKPNYILYMYDAAINLQYAGKKDKAKTMMNAAIAAKMTTLDDPYTVSDAKKWVEKNK